jgi:hypothetical protein
MPGKDSGGLGENVGFLPGRSQDLARDPGTVAQASENAAPSGGRRSPPGDEAPRGSGGASRDWAVSPENFSEVPRPGGKSRDNSARKIREDPGPHV